ncbi:unnamed protein product [Brassica napus]|uniref:(rape) hypothetical protein n=1 Tax=Brassica napus TaxID=3708 RepID=A0A816KVG2_BRANA|nr:unnamed protein product [Brassica napus]
MAWTNVAKSEYLLVKLSLRSATKVTTIPTSTTLVPSITTTARRRRFDFDVDSGRAMLEWSLGFEVADNGVSVGEETTVVRWRRNHKVFYHSKNDLVSLFVLFS